MIPMIGKTTWVIGDGFLNDTVTENYISHEAICVLNLSGSTAHINISLYFENSDPMKGFHAVCESERANHIRLDRITNDNGEAIPRTVPYAMLVESDVPIVVQYSRMDVSQPEMSLMTTIAYS